jgi:hypothetical protein
MSVSRAAGGSVEDSNTSFASLDQKPRRQTDHSMGCPDNEPCLSRIRKRLIFGSHLYQ